MKHTIKDTVGPSDDSCDEDRTNSEPEGLPWLSLKMFACISGYSIDVQSI